MLFRLVSFSAFVLLYVSAAAQAGLSAILPKGYVIAIQYEADLNQDGYPDVICVLAVDKSLSDSVLKTIFPPGHNQKLRPVVIFTGQANKTFRLAARNDQAVVQNLGQPDPFTGIRCGPGLFVLLHTTNEATKQCTEEARFEWNEKKKDWYLQNYSQSCLSSNIKSGSEPSELKEKTPKNFGKLSFSKFKYPMSLEVDDWGH
jgi:hypothetical protein